MSLTFTGLNELQQLVETLAKDQQKALLEVAGETLVSLTRERFVLGKDPYGIAWVQSARAAAQGGQTLRDKGILMNSFNWQPTSPDSLAYGTNVWYGIVHQTGWTIVPKKKKALKFNINGKTVFAKSVTIPKRTIVPDDRGDPPEYDAELLASLEAALNATLAKAGVA
jgi:phage gpG-like protein